MLLLAVLQPKLEGQFNWSRRISLEFPLQHSLQCSWRLNKVSPSSLDKSVSTINMHCRIQDGTSKYSASSPVVILRWKSLCQLQNLRHHTAFKICRHTDTVCKSNMPCTSLYTASFLEVPFACFIKFSSEISLDILNAWCIGQAMCTYLPWIEVQK